MPGSIPADCSQCGWKLETTEGVPVLLSNGDRSSPTFRDYSANYDRIADDDLAASIQPPAYLALQAETLFSYLPPLAGRRVCELGIGQGLLFEKLLAAHPASLTGIDISLAYLRRHASQGHPGLSLALANAENIPYADEFDVMIASEILEHVLNVGDLLISLHRSLADGGRLFVRVPYKEDLRQYARQNGCPYPFVHLRSFTRSSLVDLLRHAGFRARRIRYDGHYGGSRRRLTGAALRLRPALLDRLLEDGVPRRSVGPRVLGLMLRPITLTGEFEKV
jgi:SAM-dependent methyltransferase